ncbi:MAG: High-affinity branched-chain amino acid transport ATP-binding protein LivF [Planctomycetes bacterium ADurb.Bin412]|nr:MAG: High-affinity branched-chain amino acid transport ATP-binding protein LivF [Planctomycetes bacterium ADurb.Bin412]
MLRILNLEGGYGPLRVLKGISLHVSAGEVVTIIGANGAGKTTLLKTIAGILKCRSGSILFDGRPVQGVPPEKIVELGCCLVPEGRHVFPTLTVRENLLLGAYSQRRKNRSPAGPDDRFAEVYRLFGILQERHSQLAGTLSGGQQQMLAIGRALMARPRLLMLDEPSLGVAPLVMKDIYKTIAQLKQQGLTILLIEQNARAALDVADRGYVLETGQFVLEGTSRELCDNREVQRAYLGKEYKTIDE